MAGLTEEGSVSASSRGRLVATRAAATCSDLVRPRMKARRAGRLCATLATLALAICAFSASAASAADPEVSCCTVSDVSYTSAKLVGKVNSSGGPFGFTQYFFEYSTDPATKGWSEGPSGFLNGPQVDKELKVDISLPKGGTKYFVRLRAFIFSFSGGSTAISPAPYTEFTTLPVDPPQITATDNASAVFSTSATATGKVKRPANADPAFDVNCNFEYVTDDQFKATGFQGATVRSCAQNPIGSVDGGIEKTVSAPLGCTSPVSEASQGNCLEPSTTYHLRLSAQNAAPGVVTKDAASTFTTAAKVAKPTVISIKDVEVTDLEPPRGSYARVKLNGEVQRPAGTDPALDIDCRFEYITDAQFKENESNSQPGFAGASTTSCDGNPVKTENPIAVKAAQEMTADTTYHLRLAAENGGGLDTKEASTFTTPPARLPVITIDPAVAGYTTAEVSGTIEPKGCGLIGIMDYRFQYSTEPANPDSWRNSNVAGDSNTFPCESTDPVPVGGTIKGSYVSDTELQRLQPGTEYSVRLLVNTYYDPAGFSPKPNPSFTTKPVAPPKVTFDPVTNIGANTAHFSGTVSANAPGPLDALGEAAYETAWHFECVPACPGLDRAGGVGVVKDTDGTVPISIDVTDLDANQPYEIKLVATNDGGTLAPERKFSTPLVKATVKSLEGASDGEGGYTLQGIVNPNNSLVTDCKFEWGPTAPDYAFSADCSPMPGGKAKPVTVEAHLPGLTPGAVYHALLVVTNGAGTADGGDQEFIPVLFPRQKCPNEVLRKENFSLGLPECRAFEQVSPQNKNSGEVYGAVGSFTADGDVVQFASLTNFGEAGNPDPIFISSYVSQRGEIGWKMSALDGPRKSYFAGPDGFSSSPQGPMAYSGDFRSTIWAGTTKSHPGAGQDLYLRRPDGTFTLVAKAPPTNQGWTATTHPMGSYDLSHLFVDGVGNTFGGVIWGTGVYEFTPALGPTQPRRVDVDNTGAPISTCRNVNAQGYEHDAANRAISEDGRTLVFYAGGGCGGANPPVKGLYARVDATTTYNLSASQCTRTAADPGGACSTLAPPFDDPDFVYATPDGSRVFFTTPQQLLNGDIDETDDIYACDLPTTPQAPVGKANPCAALTQVSGAQSGAAVVESVLATSEDGSTVYFGAKGVLADNEDALGKTAVAGNRNIYVWRQDEANPLGRTSFIARVPDDDIYYKGEGGFQTTPDGRYLVFRTAWALVPGDTDAAKDIYRYDEEAAELIRVSFGTTGSSGNADGFDANHLPYRPMSDNGDVIAFATTEPLSPLDGNGNSDVYLWSDGRVFRLTAGAKGGSGGGVSASGADVFFATREQLVPSDRDQGNDVYDARVEGGFPQVQTGSCSGSGEACLPPPAGQPQAPDSPTALPPTDPGNVKPKTCPKGKVVKNGKCVKKQKKKQRKKSHRKHKRAAGYDRGGAK